MVIANRLKDTYQFEDLINLQEEIYRADELDLSRIEFVEPYSMVSLLLLGRNRIRSTGEKAVLVNIPVNIHQYLVRMDFFKHGIFEAREPLSDKFYLKKNPVSSRVVEITGIPNKERENVKVISNVISVFRKRAGVILKNHLSDNIVDLFVTVISELCQNIFEHSLDTGFITMQTYSTGRENIVRLVISDSGIGMKESFRDDQRFEELETAELIERAYSTPVSSKREFGYGLCQVKGIIEKLKGVVYIRSDDGSMTALYNLKAGAKSLYLKNGLAKFPGTQISISLHSGGRA